MATKTATIRNGRLITPQGIVEGDLVLEGGVIAQVGGKARTAGADVDASGCYVSPGFVSMHVHGGVGFDLTGGLFDPAAKAFDGSDERYREMLPKVAASFARHGVTSALLATVAGDEANLRRVMGLLAEHVQSEANGCGGAKIEGAFLEGSFIKAPEFAGAQNPAHFAEPSVALFDRLEDAAKGCIQYALVAPEWGEAALQLVGALAERGVATGAGHTACTADQYRTAVGKGMRVAVHLTNGPTGSSTKPFHGGGALEAALTCDEVFAELIMDGWHIHPGYVMDIVARKGLDRVCLVTDAMFATEAEGIGDFEVLGIRGALSENGEYLRVVDKPGTLFGSVLTMDRGIRNAVNWLTAGLPGVWHARHAPTDLESAVLAACRFASANPAKALGWHDPSRFRKLEDCVGSLEQGKRGDATVLKVEGGPGDVRVDIMGTFVGGRRAGGA